MDFKLPIAMATLTLSAYACSSSSAAKKPGPASGDGYRMSEPMGMDASSEIGSDPVIEVQISVKGVRVGNSVRLDVTGIGERRPPGHPMEKAENWTVVAMAGDQELARTVNGSVKVEREQVGSPSLGLWNIQVRFSVAFTVPEEAEEIMVRIAAPDSVSVYEEIMTIGPAPDKQAKDNDDEPKDKSKKPSKSRKAKKSKKPK